MSTLVADTCRALTAAAVLLTGVVHLDLWAQGFRDVATIGPLFLLTAVASLVIAVAVLAWHHWLPGLAAAGFAAMTVGAFWVSVVHGLFGVHETAGGTSEVLAQVAEYAAVLLGTATALLTRAATGRGAQAHQRLRGRRGAKAPRGMRDLRDHAA